MNNDFSYETGLIGSIIINGNYMSKVIDIVTPDDFYNVHCKAAYIAALELYSTGKTVDPLTIIEEMTNNDNDESIRLWVRDLMLETPTSHNAEIYALGVRNNAKSKRVKDLLAGAAADINDPDELISTVVEGLLSIGNNTDRKAKNLSESLMQFKQWALSKDDNRRIDTGFSRLDDILHGLFPGNLIILAARPGIGKSAFSAELALRISEKGLSSAIFSCEMSNIEIIQRFISNRGQINLNDIIDRTFLTDSNMEVSMVHAMRDIQCCPLQIFDSSDITVSDIRKTLQTIRDIRLIVVDYIQIMTPQGKSETRNLEVAKITRSLKQLAKEFQIPIIALSQLSRDKDEYDEPTLRDLRDSGAIEQDADKVIFMWKVETPDFEHQRIGVKVAKNRMSTTGTVVMQFAGDQIRFADTYHRYEPQKKKRNRQFYPVHDIDLPREWR